MDLTDWPALYANKNCRLVYLHCVLKAEYGNSWEGFCVTSYRRLADETGISVSAVRWALKQLAKYSVVRVKAISNTQHPTQQYYKSIAVQVGKKLNKQKQVTSK